MEVLKVRWFTTNVTIGVVLIKNDAGEEKAYISTVSGFDEEADIKHVQERGAKFPVEAAKLL